VAVKDAYGNLVPGTSVTFSDGGAGGVLSATPVTTNSLGQASVTYTLPTQAQTVTVTASVASLVARLSEKATAGTPTTVAAIAGNNQSGHPSTMLAAVLVVVVKDAFGNAVSGVTVMFSDAGAGGIFSSPAAVTTATGKASTSYTTPPQVGSVTINASIAGLGPAVFKENVQ
jgi:adhesin/invasin